MQELQAPSVEISFDLSAEVTIDPVRPARTERRRSIEQRQRSHAAEPLPAVVGAGVTKPEDITEPQDMAVEEVKEEDRPTTPRVNALERARQRLLELEQAAADGEAVP